MLNDSDIQEEPTDSSCQGFDDCEKEYILCAALYVDDGKSEPPRRTFAYPETGLLFAGWRHADCLVALTAWASRLPAEERERIGEVQLRGGTSGFLTSQGRFVGRSEAGRIASEAGQIQEEAYLYSEMLY